jgi:hypothetical protein
VFRAIAAGLAGFLALAAQPALAVEWFTDTDGGTITTAAFDGANSVAVSCSAGMLTFAVRVRQSEVAAPIATADPVYVLTTSDPASDGSTPSFTSRATPEQSGSLRAFTLSAKDSAARIAAFTSAKTEIEFSLLTEPGGERFNTFRLPVAGAAEALGEVLAACSGPAAEATAAQSASEEPVATTAPSSSEPPPAAKPAPAADLPPIGAGPLVDNLWHFVREGGRSYAYRRDAENHSLTFECSRSFLSITLGLPASELGPKVAPNPRANLVLRLGSEQWEETVSRVDRGDVAFYRLTGATAGDYLARVAGRPGNVSVGLGPAAYVESTSDDAISNIYFLSRDVRESGRNPLSQVLAACDRSAEPPEPVAQVQRDWSLDGWTFDESDGLVSADTEMLFDGLRLAVSWSCYEMSYGFGIRLPTKNLDPAVQDGGPVHIGTNFGGSYQSYSAERINLGERTWFSLKPDDARAALHYAQSAPGDQLVFELIDDDSGARVNHVTTTRRGLDAALGEVERACQVDLSDEDAAPDRPKDVWNYYVDAAGRPTAEIQHDGALLSFFCSDGMVFFLGLPSVHEQIADRDVIDILLSIDPVNGVATRHWVSDIGFSPDANGVSLGFRGPAVEDWARLAQGANRTIEIGLSTNAGGGQFQMYNATEFPAKGSTAAIKQLRQECK